MAFVPVRFAGFGMGLSSWASFQIRRTAVLRSVNLRTGCVPGKAFQISCRREAGHVAASLEADSQAPVAESECYEPLTAAAGEHFPPADEYLVTLETRKEEIQNRSSVTHN